MCTDLIHLRFQDDDEFDFDDCNKNEVAVTDTSVVATKIDNDFPAPMISDSEPTVAVTTNIPSSVTSETQRSVVVERSANLVRLIFLHTCVLDYSAQQFFWYICI